MRWANEGSTDSEVSVSGCHSARRRAFQSTARLRLRFHRFEKAPVLPAVRYVSELPPVVRSERPRATRTEPLTP